MENFEWNVGTRILFGRGQLDRLPEAIRERGDSVLLVYGGGSVKRSGVYGQVTERLRAAGIRWAELSGVEPNPRVTTAAEGVRICRAEELDSVLALGGGSVIDCAKLVAAARYYEGEPWDLVLDWSRVGRVMPIFSVLTLAATGSEMDAIAVISNWETSEKRSLKHLAIRPAASVLDPTFTFSVPREQTAAGTADIMSHILENYFSRCTSGYVQDAMAEGLLKTCIRYGPVALARPDDYEARANLMWCSSLAINGLIGLGKSCPWSVHAMEHQLSACYDLTHGVGLAILTPAWMRHILGPETEEKLAAYGVGVWGVDPALPARQAAEEAIARTADFFTRELGLPAALGQVGIGRERLKEMAARAAEGLGEAYVPLTARDVEQIYIDCL